MNARRTARIRTLLRFGTFLAGCLAVLLTAAPPASASRLWVRPSTGPGLCCEADVVAEGPGNSLLYYYTLASNVLVPQWRQAQIGGPGTTFSAPAIFVRSDGEADIVAEGPDNSLLYYHATPGSAWRWSLIAGAGTTYSAPSIFIRSDGEADVVAEGPGNSLRLYFATPGSRWSASAVAGDGTTYSAPSIIAENGGGGPWGVAGGPEIAVEGPDYSLSWYALVWSAGPTGQPEGPTGWIGGKVGSATGITFSAPSIVDRGGGEVDFAFTGIQNSLWYYNQTGYGPVEPSRVSGYNTAYG